MKKLPLFFNLVITLFFSNVGLGQNCDICIPITTKVINISSLAFIVNKEKIMAVSPTDGKTKWSFSKPNQQFTKLKSLSYFYSGFADKVQKEYSFIFHDFSDKSLFVMGSDSTLSALDINTGKLIWDYKLRGMPPVTYGNGLVYVPDSSSRVKAIDAITGKTRWESKLDSSAKIISKPYYFDGKLIFSAKNESGIVTGYSYFLDAADGQLITKTGGYGESTASDDSTIYRNSLGDINAYDKKTLSFKWRHFTTTEVHTLFLQKGRLVWHGFFWSNTIHSVNLGDRNDKWDILVGSGTNQEINFCGTTNSIVAISKIPDPINDTNLFSKILSLDNDTGQQIYVTDLIDANLNYPTYDNGKIVAVDRKHNNLVTF